MSSFGKNFRVTTYGASGSRSVGCIVDGCPPGMPLTEDDLRPQLSRRRRGPSPITTPGNEKDCVRIQSGTEFGVTLGTPICVLVANDEDTARSDARETIGQVAAGAIAEKYLRLAHGIEIVAFVTSVGPIHLFPRSEECSAMSSDPRFTALLQDISRETVDSFAPVRCPDGPVSARMADLIAHYRAGKDSIGGTVTCVVRNVPSGLGEPVFDKLEAVLSRAMMSIPTAVAVELGSGFGGCEMPGSRHNDAFVVASSASATATTTSAAEPSRPRVRLITKTNHSGGVQGGISNGAPVFVRVAFHPPAADETGDDGMLEPEGPHEPCVMPSAVPVVEAMAAIVLLDALLVQHGRQAARALLPPQPRVLPPEMTALDRQEAVMK
ncbi:MAG: hypothetical protein M1826_000135 [Phylliscum demangeonii]|nr:MAG: hypothetical protein M1826_000135 [Phylliscum demangeonii]